MRAGSPGWWALTHPLLNTVPSCIPSPFGACSLLSLNTSHVNALVAASAGPGWCPRSQTRVRTMWTVWEEERARARASPCSPSSLVFSRPLCPQHNKWLPQHIRADKPAAEQRGVHSSACGRVPLGGPLYRTAQAGRNYQELPFQCWAILLPVCMGASETTFPGQLLAAPPALCRAQGWGRGAIDQGPTVYQAYHVFS